MRRPPRQSSPEGLLVIRSFSRVAAPAAILVTLSALAVVVGVASVVPAAPGASADGFRRLVRPFANGSADRVTYQPPVDAPVADRFRPPATPYGAGNRGVDYDTSTGDV